jgi:tetratricopeptide (TPR) repeat protein
MLKSNGVDWDPQVREFDALQRPVKTASVWQVRQPLYRSSIGRWRKDRHCLAPLIAGTNRKIAWEPIEMVTLPKPGWLNAGVDRYRQGDLDGAESHFKRLLQHLPEHAAAGFMLGLVYVRKGHLRAGIPLLEQAHARCPWNRHWRQDLAQAYRLDGRDDDAEALGHAPADHPAAPLEPHAGKASVERLDYLFLSGETTCRSPGPAPSGTS